MLTADRLRSDFNAQVGSQAQNIAGEVHFGLRAGKLYRRRLHAVCGGHRRGGPDLHGGRPAGLHDARRAEPRKPACPVGQINGYRVATFGVNFGPGGGNAIIVQYGLPVTQLAGEIANLELIWGLPC